MIGRRAAGVLLLPALLFVARLPSDNKPLVAIQPLGNVTSSQVQAVRQGVTRLYDVDIEVLPIKPLPKKAFYKPRSRYRADHILD